MNASMNSRILRSGFDLIRMSTTRLQDDTRVRLHVPLRAQTAFTATIAECLMAKGAAHV